MAKTEWTVRLINFKPAERPAERQIFRGDNEWLSGLWVEQLRHMGFARELAEFDDPERTVVEFYAPRGTDSQHWAKENAERMHSFGFNAVAAPRWDRGTDLKPIYDQAKAGHRV